MERGSLIDEPAQVDNEPERIEQPSEINRRGKSEHEKDLDRETRDATAASLGSGVGRWRLRCAARCSEAGQPSPTHALNLARAGTQCSSITDSPPHGAGRFVRQAHACCLDWAAGRRIATGATR